MKYYKKIIWFVLAFHIALISFVIWNFRVDDMTLSKGEVYTFDRNWTLTRQDGETVELAELPFRGKSQPGGSIGDGKYYSTGILWNDNVFLVGR